MTANTYNPSARPALHASPAMPLRTEVYPEASGRVPRRNRIAKERPIIFSNAMVRAILAGSKTQTRRIAKSMRHPDLGNIYSPGTFVLGGEPQHVIERACPFGQPGDRLWVRETWQAFFEDEVPADRPRGPRHTLGIPAQPDLLSYVYYRADGEVVAPDPSYGAARWRSPLHLPRKYARLTLEITSVRVERLRDIAEADAIAEGVSVHPDHYGRPETSIYSPVQAFRDVWASINGPDSWGANPWVWVIEFQRVAE